MLCRAPPHPAPAATHTYLARFDGTTVDFVAKLGPDPHAATFSLDGAYYWFAHDPEG